MTNEKQVMPGCKPWLIEKKQREDEEALACGSRWSFNIRSTILAEVTPSYVWTLSEYVGVRKIYDDGFSTPVVSLSQESEEGAVSLPF